MTSPEERFLKSRVNQSLSEKKMPVSPEVGGRLMGAHPEYQRLRVSAEDRE